MSVMQTRYLSSLREEVLLKNAAVKMTAFPVRRSVGMAAAKMAAVPVIFVKLYGYGFLEG